MNDGNLFFEEAKLALAEKGEFSNMTTGISMYPMLRSGRDIIVIKPPEFPLKKHDVALYRKNGYGKLILHRIIRQKEDGSYVIRGDNTYFNETVKEDDIAGVLKGFIRNGKYTDCAASKPYHLYIALMRFFYPARFFWKRIAVPVLSKIKHAVIK